MPAPADNRNKHRTQSRNVRRPRQTSTGQGSAAPRRTGVFAPGLKPPTETFKRAQRTNRRRVEQAQRRLPQRPLPAVPALRNPTPAQRTTANRLVSRSRQAQAGGRARTSERLAALDRELLEDPRTRAQLAAILATAAPSRAAQARALRTRQLRAGPKHTTVRIPGAGVVDLTAIDRATFGALTEKATRGHGVGGRLVADVVNLPKVMTVGALEAARAGFDLTQGDTERARKLISTIDDGALGELVYAANDARRLNFKGAEKHLKAAAKAADEHPLYSGLEFTGAGQVVGRAAGMAMRSGALGARAKRAGSTKRADLQVLEGTGQVVKRSYSKNALVKGMQVAAEREARRQGRDPNVATSSPVGRFATPIRGHAVRDRASLLDSAVDEFAAQAEAVRRRGRQESVKASGRMAPARATGRVTGPLDRAVTAAADAGIRPTGSRRRPERDIVFAAVEGRVSPKTWRRDLKRERARLISARAEGVGDAPGKALSRSARLENERQVKAIDRALNDPKFDPRALFESATQVARESRRIEDAQVERKIVVPEQARAARLRPAAIAVLGLRDSPEGDGLVDAKGNRVSTDQIEARLRSAGRDPDQIGFLGHRRDTRGARSFFVNWFDRRVTTDSKRRSGEATRRGTHAADYTAVREDLVRRQGVLDAVDTFDAFIGQFAVRGPNGKHLTWDQAERYADELADRTGEQWVPIRAFPARYEQDRWAAIAEDQDAPAGQEAGHFTASMIDEAMRKGGQARNVVVVPERQIKRFRSHQLQGSGVGGRIGQGMTGLFRNTVLPFSSKWIFGNVTEAALRSALEGIGPGTVIKGHVTMRRLRALDEGAYRAMDARVRGGLMFGSQEQLRVRRAVEDFAESPTLENAVRFASLVGRLPVVRQTIGGVMVLAKMSLSLNRGIERLYQTGVIGKQVRNEIREVTGDWHKALGLQRQALDDVVRGLTETPAQIRFARATDNILGKYGRFSPSTRRFIQTFAPFLPWFLNAARFVSYTLPVRHPVKTAVVTSMGEAMMASWEAEHRDLPPGSLRFAIPKKDGGWLDLARYAPFGAFTQGPEILADQVLPQVTSPLQILSGLSWKHRKLQTEDGEVVGDGKKIAMALYSAAEAFVPLLSMARRVREGGETAYDDSTVWDPKTKSGTDYGGGAVDRIFNPVRPTYLGPPTSGSSSSAPPLDMDPVDVDELRQAAGAAPQLDPADLDELRSLAAGR